MLRFISNLRLYTDNGYTCPAHMFVLIFCMVAVMLYSVMQSMKKPTEK